jgi:haloalkane dehalogenase
MSRPTTDNEAVELFRREPQRYLPVATGEVAYRRVGNGPDVLFVHGWPVSGATFRHLLPHLAHHVTCHVIDLPGAGASRFLPDTRLSFDGHIAAVRQVVETLGFDSYAVVGHNSGGLIARHAIADDPRLRALGLIDTEQPHGLNRRFRHFLVAGRVPGFGAALGWAIGSRRLRRSTLILGEFDEFFLEPIRSQRNRRDAAVALLRSFDQRYVRELVALHRRITAPVQLVWGENDPFFPVRWAQEMVDTFPQAQLHVVPGARLFSHEEKPVEVAAALLPVLEARG